MRTEVGEWGGGGQVTDRKLTGWATVSGTWKWDLGGEGKHTLLLVFEDVLSRGVFQQLHPPGDWGLLSEST